MVSLRDLEDPRRIAIFEDMERFQRLLRAALQANWPDVPWPMDALHQWSRQYEYPFAFHHLASRRQGDPKVLDAGSGLTSFQYYLRLNGFEVTCVDRDSRLATSYSALRLALPERLRVEFVQADLRRIPCPSGQFSQLCCISVIEHIPHAEIPDVLNEFSRVTRPGGLVVITIDVPMDTSFRPLQDGTFVALLRESKLEPIGEIATDVPPENLLSTRYYKTHKPALLPWAYPGSRSGFRRFRHYLKTSVLRRPHFESLGLATFICICDR
jgi:ubiquinone/menaquinone biosynthesis C-methylase UbiE